MDVGKVKPIKEKLDPLVVKAAIILVIGFLAPLLTLLW